MTLQKDTSAGIIHLCILSHPDKLFQPQICGIKATLKGSFPVASEVIYCEER